MRTGRVTTADLQEAFEGKTVQEWVYEHMTRCEYVGDKEDWEEQKNWAPFKVMGEMQYRYVSFLTSFFILWFNAVFIADCRLHILQADKT
jgi:hypothetical protein